MNIYLINSKEIKELVEAIENELYKHKKQQFKHDPSYQPIKTEIPLKSVLKALKKYKY